MCNTAQHCRLGHSKTQILLATSRTQHQLREEAYVSLEVERSSPLPGCARNKRQYPTVLQNPKVFRWMLGCEWMGYVLLTYDRSVMFIEQQETVRGITNPNPKQQGNRDVDQLSHVDYVTTNANSSQGESQLYIFEDNDAVIKMLIKGRSPTLRHVSRTHSVALDWWLFDRINLDPKKTKSNMLTPKNQLAGILTKGSFSRDGSNHLLCLFNISHFSSINSRKAMSKRTQGESQLYIFEDNEAVIKMIIKRRRPAMRRVSRTHRIALDCLFDSQFGPKGSLTRDEWDHLLRLLNIMNFSMFSCSHFLSNRKQGVMSKRAQESTSEEGSAVAKSRPMNLV